MRKKICQNGITVKGYAGTTGILLAMNIEPEKRAGLLGFAIERRDFARKKKDWLRGQLHFPGVSCQPGDTFPTNVAPIQKFRWSDYCVYPAKEYEYTIHPVYGTPGQPLIAEGPTIRLKTSDNNQGNHQVTFNRAAAGSQAFSRKFPELEKEMEEEQKKARKEGRHPDLALPPAALKWLARGVDDKITWFIGQATDENWALDIAIYEYELPEIIEAVNRADARGARVRVVYHAKPHDAQTATNETNLVGLPPHARRPRLTSAICHDKFIVLSRLENGLRVPQAILCGSTNFTENGCYRQANVVHVIELPEIARRYLTLFELLFQGTSQSGMRKWITQNNRMAEPDPLFIGFSPRADCCDLETFASAIKAARSDVLFCTAFNMDDRVEGALMGAPHDPVLRYGVENTQGNLIRGFHADQTAEFVATALLPEGLEGFLKESMLHQEGHILIHTKLVIVDFTSDDPLVISGSHNLSHGASYGNDENFMMLRGNIDVADAYGCELLRVYDHYRFRFHISQKAKKGEETKPLSLCMDDTWTVPYFDGDALKTRDRLRFSGN